MTLDLDRMRELWEGAPELSATEIGARFGVSKNVVIGQAHRRGWRRRRGRAADHLRPARRSVQPALDLIGGKSLVPGRTVGGELGTGDTLPAGPYTVGLTIWQGGDDEVHLGQPWVIRCGQGRAIAGHIPSREIAQAIADALNRERPA